LIAFPPGGPTDFVGRLLADKMSTLLGQRVYIENGRSPDASRQGTTEIGRKLPPVLNLPALV